MGQESSRLRLVAGLREWREELSALDAMLTDHPLDDPVALIDDLGDAVLEVRGWVEDALEKAERLGAGQIGPRLSEATRRALPEIHRAFHTATVRYLTRLAPSDRDYELRRLGRLRGGEWSAWSHAVRKSLASCGRPAVAASEALLECWCDLLDRLSAPPGVQQTVTIYQTDRPNEPVGIQQS